VERGQLPQQELLPTQQTMGGISRRRWMRCTPFCQPANHSTCGTIAACMLPMQP